VLAGVGLVGLAGAITACGGSSSSTSTPAAANPTTSSDGMASSAAPASSAAASGASQGAGAANALTSTSKVPVGGGTIITDKKIVVTQPSSGEFKAFTAVCTHMGCIVNQVSKGTIDCPCHGSQYSVTTGAVVAGPAPKALPSVPIKVSGDNIFLA
jgi:Rieske Fe-S protein